MRRLAIYLGGGMLLVASSALAQSSFDKGASSYKRGDYATALAAFRPLAENGDAKAQSILALMYSYGEGVPVDYREAARWYRRAAEQGSSVAQYNLGMLYLEGRGVAHDTDKAIDWLTRAADGGHFRARSELAKLNVASYSNLTAEPKDSLEAPPAMKTAAPEPRSVVMRDPAPPPAEPTLASNAAKAITVSAATTTTAKPTNSHMPVINDTPAVDATPVNNGTPANNHAATVNHTETGIQTSAVTASDNAMYRVQLAASRSEEYIRRDWSSYQQRYADIFGGLDASFERAEVGEPKTVWYRLRVGPFASEASAKALCEKLNARGIKTGCLPLRVTR